LNCDEVINIENENENTIARVRGDGPEASGKALRAAGGWCAPGGARYPTAVLEPDFPWPPRAPTARQRPHVTPEMRHRWAEEDRWLREQLALCRPVDDVETRR
jgi:hypothetical protein